MTKVKTMSVMSYAHKKLGRELGLDTDLDTLGINTPCGKDCKRAIDAAYEMLKVAKMAFGERYKQQIIEMVVDVVECFYFG